MDVFQTDPQNTDYELEAGATRNFEASRTAEKMALQEQKEKEAEEANNPMKVTTVFSDNISLLVYPNKNLLFNKPIEKIIDF